MMIKAYIAVIEIDLSFDNCYICLSDKRNKKIQKQRQHLLRSKPYGIRLQLDIV